MSQPFELKPARIVSRDYQPQARQAAISSDSLVDSRLFARLMADDYGEPSLRPQVSCSVPCADVGLIHAMAEQLAPRLSGGGQWPMQFVIELARLGRINVSARYERRVWNIALEAEQASTYQWLVNHQQITQERLAQTLGQPIRVQLFQERQA